jgi:hypothetical protein
LEILAIQAIRAAASQAFSEPKVFNLDTQSNVVRLQSSYWPEFRMRQSVFKFPDSYDDRIFDAVFSFSQYIHVRLAWTRNNDFKCDNTAFDGPERLQY